MDDHLFINLIKSNQSLLENNCCQTKDCSFIKQCSFLNFHSQNLTQFKLKIINLSGCYRLTDYGLK